MSKRTIGFVGLGAMGSGLAVNLQKYLASRGEQLVVYNRTKEKAEVQNLLQQGAKWACSPAELASSCAVVFSMLAADAALRSVFESYLSGSPAKGAIFVDCSTVYPDLTKSLEAQGKTAGVTYISAPVFGRPDVALAGRALVVCAGDPDAKAQVLPYLEAMGRRVVDVGDEARKGSALKLVGNFFIVSMVELIGEGMTLADKNGIPRDVVVDFLRESFPGPITGGYADKIANNSFAMTQAKPGFSVRGGLKDATHIHSLANASGVVMPVIDLVVSRFQELSRRGAADNLDWSSLPLLIREEAGIEDAQGLLQ